MSLPSPPELERLSYYLVDATRSIGLEAGIDLLLDLLYIRWATAANIQGAERWDQFRMEMTRQPDGAVVDRLLARLIPFPFHHRTSTEDGGHALRHAIHGIESWGLDTSSLTFREDVHVAFEALLKIRSERVSRAGLENETSVEVAMLMARCATPMSSALDPACGLGAALLAAARAGAKRLVGWEINAGVAARTFMRFQLANVPLDLHVGNGLNHDFASEHFDAVLVQPPWNQRLHDEQWSALHGMRYGKPARASADFLWLQAAQAAIGKNGRAVALMPASTLFRAHSEGRIRAAMLQDGVVEAVILIPSAIAGSGIVGCAWILRQATGERRPAVLAVDIGPLVAAEGARPVLTIDDIGLISGAVHRWRDGASDLGVPSHIALGIPLSELVEAGSIVPSRHLPPAPADRAIRPSPPTQLLSELRVQNLKAFGEKQVVPLAPITLIYGANSAGKSTLLQALLLLKQSFSSKAFTTQGELTDAGSFVGVLHNHDVDRAITLGVTYGASQAWDIPDTGIPDPSLLRSVDFNVAADGSGLPREDSITIGFGDWLLPFRSVPGTTVQQKNAFEVDLAVLSTVFAGVSGGRLLYPFDSRRSDADGDAGLERRLRDRVRNGERAIRTMRAAGIQSLRVEADGILPSGNADIDRVRTTYRGLTGRELGIVQSYVNRTMHLAAGVSDELRLLFDELSYLGPMRSAPQRFYSRAATPASWGSAGEHIALYLFDNASELDKVNEWLETLEIPYSLRVTPVIAAGSTSIVGDLVAIVLADRRSGVDLTPADVGFGVSQILPIVVGLLSKRRTVICIEQPEIHLHPRLQARLGDLLIEATAGDGLANQVLVETHSEHLILRLRRRIREGALDARQVAVLYVDSQTDGSSRVLRLRLDEVGDFIDEWPQGFFDERLEELFGGTE